jgi:hypothetical protein
MTTDDLMDRVFFTAIEVLIAGLVGFLVGAILAMGLDSVQSYRAYDKRMVPRLCDFSAKVTCIPNPARRDTLGIERVSLPHRRLDDDR